eukprot:gene10717-22379_t
MDDLYLGSIAAALSSLFMTIGFIAWDKSWKGTPFYLNLFKCSLASFLFFIIAMIYRSENGFFIPIFPLSMLCLSSLLGIVIGDNTWLTALQMIGLRRVITVDALKPFLSEFFGVVMLHEPLYASIVVGMVLTTGGVLIVALEGDQSETKSNGESNKDFPSSHTNSDKSLDSLESDLAHEDRDTKVHKLSGQMLPHFIKRTVIVIFSRSCRYLKSFQMSKKLLTGYFLSLLNVVFDAYGAVLTKRYGTSMNDWEINAVRFGFAAVVMLIYVILADTIPNATNELSRYLQSMRETDSYEQQHTLLPLEETEESGFDDDYPVCSWDGQDNGEFPEIQLTTTSVLTGDSNTGTADHIQIPLDSMGISSSINNSPLKDSNGKKVLSNGDGGEEKPFHSMLSMTRVDWIWATFGVLCVTFLSSALSNFALFVTPISLWITLTSLGPLYSLPLVYLMKGEVVSGRACVGAAMAVLGVAVMCLMKF